MAREIIYVNKPLRYKGVTVYQTDWGITGLKVRVRPVAEVPELGVTAKPGMCCLLMPRPVPLVEGS